MHPGIILSVRMKILLAKLCLWHIGPCKSERRRGSSRFLKCRPENGLGEMNFNTFITVLLAVWDTLFMSLKKKKKSVINYVRNKQWLGK